MTKPTELDANRLLDSQMPEHYSDHMERVLGRPSVGCHGDCADSGECTCSHASAPRRPRQPRRPEPRTPHLPLWTRLSIRWQALRAAWARRERWAWVDCGGDRDGWCCTTSYGDGGIDYAHFTGCAADRHNDWVAARFWRRWVATLRERL